MAMLKAIGQGHTRPVELAETGGASGHRSSAKDLDDYLAWEPKRERRSKRIERYLESGHDHPARCLAFSKTDAFLYSGEHGWAEEMDRTREQMELTKRANARTYYHYVISPDPADHAGAEELRDLGLEWIAKCLPGTQAVVSVHDDNAEHIMHAHVVVNAVYPATGRRVHITDRKAQRQAHVLQELCLEHGMTAMPDKMEQDQA